MLSEFLCFLFPVSPYAVGAIVSAVLAVVLIIIFILLAMRMRVGSGTLVQMVWGGGGGYWT